MNISNNQEKPVSPQKENLKEKAKSKVFDFTNGISQTTLRELYEIASSRGIFNGDWTSFVRSHQKDGLDIAHLSGNIEKEIITRSATFGANEMAYLKSLGKKEIVRLQKLEQPQFLLVGSLGKYSALEFSQFTKKINASAVPNVIDLNLDLMPIYKEIQGVNGLQIAMADGLQMPYRDDAFDFIATNQLLHALKSDEGKATPNNVKKFFKEVCRVLKPGGKFIIYEQPFGRLRGIDGENFRVELREMAEEGGFEVETLSGGYAFAFRADASCARIDEGGEVDYGDATVFYNDNDARLRLTK